MSVTTFRHPAVMVAGITWQIIIYVFHVEGVFDGVFAWLGIEGGAAGFPKVAAAVALLELPLLMGIGCLWWWSSARSPRMGRLRVPLWLVCGLLPWPALVLLRAGDGSGVALWLYFIGCTTLVARAFAADLPARSELEVGAGGLMWRRRLMRAGAGLLAVFLMFAVAQLALKGVSDLVEIGLAFLILIPSLCVVPYLTLVTRKVFSTVVLTPFVVACMKFLGCLVVVLVYGWDAAERGYTSMPWTQPNLLVWLFWLNMSVLCTWLYFLGRRRFQEQHRPAV